MKPSLFTNTRTHSKAARRSGVATVELAVVLPILLVLVFGTIEVCQRIFLRQSAVIVAYEGARLAARGISSNAEVTARCQQLLTSRRVRNATVTTVPANFMQSPTGTEIRITITVPWADNSPSKVVVPNQGSMTVSAFMLRE